MIADDTTMTTTDARSRRFETARSRDVALGLLLLVFGIAVAWHALRYPQGTLRDMGPGFVPRHLGILVAGFGVLVLARAALAFAAKTGTQRETAPHALALAIPPAAVMVFALTIDRLGLPIATFLTSLLLAQAWPAARRIEALVVAAIIAAATTLLFPILLRVPFPLLPA